MNISLDNTTLGMFRDYCQLVDDSDSFIDSPRALHPQILRELFEATRNYSTSVVDPTRLTTRKELAILLSPTQVFRSPHYELVAHYAMLAKLNNINSTIYISLVPSVAQQSHNYKYLEHGLDNFIGSIKLLISDSYKGIGSLEFRILTCQHDDSILLKNIVSDHLSVLYHSNSKPLVTLSLSGGGAKFLGSLGLEWLDAISTHVENRYYAMMGLYDHAIDKHFYTRYLTQPGHPYAKKDGSNVLHISLDDKHYSETNYPHLSSQEQKLFNKIESIDPLSPILLYTSSMLHKRFTEYDILFLHVLKSLLPNIKFIILGEYSELCISRVLEHRLSILADDEGCTLFLKNKISVSLRLSRKFFSSQDSSRFNETKNNKTFHFLSSSQKFPHSLSDRDFICFGWLDNLESFFYHLSQFNSTRPGCLLYSFSNNTGNGQTNSIAAYSALPSIFRYPNDSRRSLPQSFFTHDFLSYLKLCYSCLYSKPFNSNILADQQNDLLAFKKIYNHHSLANKFFSL